MRLSPYRPGDPDRLLAVLVGPEPMTSWARRDPFADWPRLDGPWPPVTPLEGLKPGQGEWYWRPTEPLQMVGVLNPDRNTFDVSVSFP